VLAPFSDWRAQIGTTFIIDLWFSGIIVAGLVASSSLRRCAGRRSRRAPSSSATSASVLAKRKSARVRRAPRARARAGARLSTCSRGRLAIQNWTVFVSDARGAPLRPRELKRTEPRSYRPGRFIAMLDSVYSHCRRPTGKRERATEKAQRRRSRRKRGFTRDGGLSLVPIPAFGRPSRARPACGLSTCGFTLPGAPLSRSATAPAATGPQHLGGSSRPESQSASPRAACRYRPTCPCRLDPRRRTARACRLPGPCPDRPGCA